MNSDLLAFFEKKPGAFLLYQALEERILAEIPQVSVKVQKTQISFFNRHQFACASFLPVRRAKDRPKDFLVVSFGLSCPLASPRIDAVVEPYPNRFTHHLLLSSPGEVDGELMEWLKEAAAFSAAKR